MFGLFDRLRHHKLIRLMRNATEESLEEESFYLQLKELTASSSTWSTRLKNDFVAATLSIFEGVASWDFIAAESPQRIFSLTQAEGYTLACLELVAELFPDTKNTKRLLYILSEVERIKQRQRNPIYNLHQKPKAIFKDPGFKLAVINQLMFKENLLKPQFDPMLFAEEFSKYFIDMEYHQASAEGMQYLLNLDIPSDLLNSIEDLYLDSKAALYRKICFFSPTNMLLGMKMPQRGRYVPICDSAVEDLALLPNLSKVHIGSDDKFVELDEMPRGCDFIISPNEARNGTPISAAFIQALEKQKIQLLQGGKPVVLEKAII